MDLITKFVLFVDLTDISDSMLLDSGICIAKLTTPEDKVMTLDVKGDVKVVAYDDRSGVENIYRYYSDMPASLKKRIKDGSYRNGNCIWVTDSNWFELSYNGGRCRQCVDAKNLVPAEIYELMARTINQMEDRTVVPPFMNKYTIINSSGDAERVFYNQEEAEVFRDILIDAHDEHYTLISETSENVVFERKVSS